MANQTAIIFGGSGGIGAALAQRLHNRGYALTLVGRNAETLEAIAGPLGAQVHVADATKSSEVDAAIEAAVKHHGGVNAVVNCVGSILLKPAHLTSDEDWFLTLNQNLTSSFFIVRAAVKVMRRSGGGAIALTSSAIHSVGLANHEAISAAKAGVVGLARSAAASYATAGIRVNAVAPGLVDTPMAKGITGNENALKFSLGMHATGRIGKPEDIASALEWVISPEQTWLTAQVINVEGGLTSIKLH